MRDCTASPGRSAGKIWRVVAVLFAAGLVSTFLGACQDQLVTGPVEETSKTPDAPTAETITIKRLWPHEAEQGETLEVRIYGEGFPEDAVAVWEREGVEDSSILVGPVTVISSTELKTTITIAGDARLGYRDVVVFSNKKGIGSETKGVGEDVFEVKEYTPTPLGFTQGIWSGAGSIALGINDLGVVVGRGDGDGVSVPVSWTSTAGLVSFAGSQRGVAVAINNAGTIVGARGDFFSGIANTAYVFEGGFVTNLQSLAAPYASSAFAINDAGVVVGSGARDLHSDPTWPIYWKRGTDGRYGRPVELPLPDGEQWGVGEHWEGSAAVSINSNGDVVGTLLTGRNDIRTRAVLWRVRSDGSYDTPLLLGGGTETEASAINDAGWIAGTIGGWYQPMRAVLWHPDNYSAPIALTGATGTETFASGINNHGQIVGVQRQGANDLAILWRVDASGQMIESKLLPPAKGYTSSSASAINDAGWIVGTSSQGHSFCQGCVTLPGESTFNAGRWEATLWRPDR